jgi:cysteine synthase
MTILSHPQPLSPDPRVVRSGLDAPLAAEETKSFLQRSRIVAGDSLGANVTAMLAVTRTFRVWTVDVACWS